MTFFRKMSLVVFSLLCAVSLVANAHDDDEQKEYGMAGDPHHIGRTVVVDMEDSMKYMSGDLQVKKGETIKFVVHNKSHAMKHEMVLGTMKSLEEHATYMKKFPNMEHAEAHEVSVDPDKSGEIIWTFNKSGTFYYACLVPGHMEAGMINKITVN